LRKEPQMSDPGAKFTVAIRAGFVPRGAGAEPSVASKAAKMWVHGGAALQL
jgi:hypothetical protein